MAKTCYNWTTDQGEHALELVRVEGTNGRPYLFGDGDQRRSVEVPEFWLATVTVTQALWEHIMVRIRRWGVDHNARWRTCPGTQS